MGLSCGATRKQTSGLLTTLRVEEKGKESQDCYGYLCQLKYSRAKWKLEWPMAHSEMDSLTPTKLISIILDMVGWKVLRNHMESQWRLMRIPQAERVSKTVVY